MKWLVLLSGCGLGDGSCIEETVMSYIALDRYHCDYLPVAENRIEPSVDHFTERTGERRSVLTESARIGRGRIQDLSQIHLKDYDALLIPGGIGLLANYAQSKAVSQCVLYFSGPGRKIGSMCAGIDFLRGILGTELLRKETEDLQAASFCCDKDRKIFYTPAFRKTSSCDIALLGVCAMIQAMLKN